MNRSLVAVMMAGSLSLGACATTDPYASNSDNTIQGVGTGAILGGAAGAGVGALVGGPLAGALIGAAVGGIAGAVWADRNNDGQTDGYYQNGTYYEGAPVQGAYQAPPPAPYYPPAPAPVYRSGERG